MLNLLELEARLPGKTQLDRARLLTFDFNPALISMACEHWGDLDYERLLKEIVKHRTLLEPEDVSLSDFFQRISLISQVMDSSTESIRPFVKSGVHLESSTTFLSQGSYFVSKNEKSYLVKVEDWFVEPKNPTFSQVVNSHRGLLFAYSPDFNYSCLSDKADIAVVTPHEIRLKDGRLFTVIKLGHA